MKTNPNKLWILVIALGWLFDFLFWKKAPGVNFAIFAALCLAGAFYLLLSDGLKPNRNSLLLLPIFGFFAVVTFIRAEPMTAFLAYTFTLFSMSVLAVTYLGGRWIHYAISDYLGKFLNLAGSVIARPLVFSNDFRKSQMEAGIVPVKRNIWPIVPAAIFPRVLLEQADASFPRALAIRTESLTDFVAAQGLRVQPEDDPFTPCRRITVSVEKGTRFEAVETCGSCGLVSFKPRAGGAASLSDARELWRTRRRSFQDSSEGYRSAHSILDRIIELVGRDLACRVVFDEERSYWQRRNRAGQIQRQRQDNLGLGWANHDHHTFRSSRERFLELMSILEKLGFMRRERYYAGAQAGWGAQIMEQPVEGIVVFADLDLMPEETELDFSRQPLKPAPHLGTVGLWVALHGESFLESGMHHLAARFDFALARQQLQRRDIASMPPFSNFSFLKQAFTEGERWPVRRERVEDLRQSGLITEEQLRRFAGEGAIGSHLETLERRGGFKGFNQDSVSAIIAATDPRKQAIRSA